MPPIRPRPRLVLPVFVAAIALFATAAAASGDGKQEGTHDGARSSDYRGCRSNLGVGLAKLYSNGTRMAAPVKARNCGGRPKACVVLHWGKVVPFHGFDWSPKADKCVRIPSRGVAFAAATSRCAPGIYYGEAVLFNSQGKVVMRKRSKKLVSTACNPKNW